MSEEIRIRETVIFDGNEGYRYTDGLIYRLVVGAATCQAENGDLFCSWMSGTGGEPEQGHCAMYAKSTDNGKTWSEPVVFVPPAEVNGAGGLMDLDGHLYRLRARWPLEKMYTEWHYIIDESTDNGQTWEREHEVKFWSEDFNSSHAGMLKLADGSWMGISQLNTPRQKPLVASAVDLAFANTEEEAQALPACEKEVEGLEYLQLHKEKRFGVGVFRCDEHFEHFEFLGKVMNRPMGLIEPSMVELTDGTLCLLCRAELGGFVWRSDSKDTGKTWSEAYETDIPSASTLVKAIRLPDDRIALFLNPLGKKGERGSRGVLSVWISDDDMKTWYLKKDIAVGGYLSYPNPILLKNGQLAVSFDDRRKARFIEVDLPPKRVKKG